MYYIMTLHVQVQLPHDVDYCNTVTYCGGSKADRLYD